MQAPKVSTVVSTVESTVARLAAILNACNRATAELINVGNGYSPRDILSAPKLAHTPLLHKPGERQVDLDSEVVGDLARKALSKNRPEFIRAHRLRARAKDFNEMLADSWLSVSKAGRG